MEKYLVESLLQKLHLVTLLSLTSSAYHVTWKQLNMCSRGNSSSKPDRTGRDGKNANSQKCSTALRVVRWVIIIEKVACATVHQNRIELVATDNSIKQSKCLITLFVITHSEIRQRSGSVVECLTRDRRAAGSSLIGVTALWSLSKTHLS